MTPPYRYPAPRTGTAQDLMRVITKAYEEKLEREGIKLPIKSEAQRRFIEPVIRSVGIGIAGALRLLPAELALSFHEKLFSALAGGRRYEFDAGSPQVRGALELASALERETGKAPALLAAISHPPTMGDLSHLNFELVRHALHALRAVRGRACRPRLVVAIDPFALDTANIYEEGVYAGFMGTYHVGIDRLALGRGQLGPELTTSARWDRMPARLFRTLSRGGEIGMVLSGGVPSTGRVLYAVREWSRRARSLSPLRGSPREALAALRRDRSFARFENVLGEALPLPASAWRRMDAWLMAAAVGLLPDETAQSAATAALAALSVPAADGERLLGELTKDFTRETPARRRLFRVLAGRVLRRRPLVLLPIVHGTAPLGVTTKPAWAVERAEGGLVRVRRAGAPAAAAETMTPERLAETFTEENFA